jgi:rubrerythrin
MRLTELHDDLTALRADLAAELEAISRLEAQTFSLNDEEAREDVRRIADEKKAHAASLIRQLERLDPKFAAIRSGRPHV